MTKTQTARAAQIGLALAAIVVMTTSCGGSAGAQSARQAFTTTSLAAGMLTSLRFNATPTTAIASAAAGFSGRPGQSALQLRAESRLGAYATACGYTVTPDTASKVDVDGDSIPLTRSWTYDYDSDACGLSTGGTRWKFKGTYLETDLDDAKKWMSGGFKYVWDYTGAYTFPAVSSGSGKTYPAGSYAYIGKGSYSGKQAGAAFTHQGDYSGNTKWTRGTSTGAYDYTGTFKHTITPDTFTENDAWKKGKAEFSGTWSYLGQVPQEEQDSATSTATSTETDITFTASSKDLTYDSTCSRFWKTGSFFYDVGNSHVFEYRYNCTGVKYYYDSKEWDPTARS